MNNLLCHWEKYHRKKKLRPISHEKKSHLGKICVTIIDFIVTFDEKTDLSDVICEERSKSSGKPVKAILKNNNQY